MGRLQGRALQYDGHSTEGVGIHSLTPRCPKGRPPHSPSAPPDAVLVEAAQAGDAGAGAELLGRYRGRVHLYALRQLGQREEALDVTQEVLLKAWAGLGRFRSGCAFATWIHRIAVNCCLDRLRSRQRAPQPLSLEALLEAEPEHELPDGRPGCDPHAAAAGRELDRAVHAAVDALPEGLRHAVTLHALEGLSEREVSDRLGCPPGTVKSRLYRARGLLRANLSPWVAG